MGNNSSQDIVHQLKRLMSNLTEFHTDCHKVGMTLIRVEIYMIVNDSTSLSYSFQLFHGVKLFPIDLDLARTAFQYQSTNPVIQVCQKKVRSFWIFVLF